MPRAYSLDLRERVVAAVAAGQSRRAVARIFKLGEATVIRWSQRLAETGSVAARPMGGKRPYALATERQWVLDRVAAVPDITLRALALELAGRGVKVSSYAVWHFLQHEGISFKKNAARQRAGSARHRQAARTMAQISDAF